MIKYISGIALLCVALSAQDKAVTDAAITEGVVDAPLAEVWRVFSTAQGYKNLGVAQVDMDFRPGGLIRTHYDPKGQLGDEGTIVTEILAYDPGHSITTRIARPPKGFPFPTAYKTVWTVVTLTDAGSGHTHLREAMVGFDATAESQAMRAFFERGNATVLEELQRHYAKPAAAANAAPGHLDALKPLIGRDWSAPLPGGQVTDTQRFEWMYGNRFIRNTHWVKTPNGDVVYEGETVYAWDSRADRMGIRLLGPELVYQGAPMISEGSRKRATAESPRRMKASFYQKSPKFALRVASQVQKMDEDASFNGSEILKRSDSANSSEYHSSDKKP